MVTINIFMIQQMVVKLQVKRITEHESSREIKCVYSVVLAHCDCVSFSRNFDESLLLLPNNMAHLSLFSLYKKRCHASYEHCEFRNQRHITQTWNKCGWKIQDTHSFFLELARNVQFSAFKAKQCFLI